MLTTPSDQGALSGEGGGVDRTQHGQGAHQRNERLTVWRDTRYCQVFTRMGRGMGLWGSRSRAIVIR